MTTYANGSTLVRRPSSGNPWGAFVSHSPESYTDPPTDDLTLQHALSAWKRMFGDHGLTLGVQDPVPLQQGHVLGAGGIGTVYETKIDGIALAWKRIYTRSQIQRERYLNEVKILGHMTEQRHKHIVNLIGSYTHRLRNSSYELAILTWPVARCDLSVLMREVDLINEWKSRDETWEEDDWATQPTDEEKTAFENLLKIEHLEQDRSTTFTWHLRERAVSATLQRLTRSIGCIAEAVRYLHDNGIRHKDIKPSQVLVSSDGLWLTDFGWSRDISQLTSSETSGGDNITVRYHAPERTQMGSCGRAEDIFSLGCTFLEMGYRICGQRSKDYLNPACTSMWSFQANLGSMDFWLTPFRSEELSLKSFLGGVIERMMAYKASERPTIGETIEILQLHSQYNSGSFFGPCCEFHELLQAPSNERSTGPGSASTPPQDEPLSPEQLSQSLGRHEGVSDQLSEDTASTAVACSDCDLNNYVEPECSIDLKDEDNKLEAPITRFVRMLHEAQSLQHSSQEDNLSLSFPDGTVFQCICGRPSVTGQIVQCIKCRSWQHVLCYYSAGRGPRGHECLMCKSEASMLMPTRDERPPRLRTPGSALTTGGSGMIDQDLPSFLRDTARAIDGVFKSDPDHIRRFEWLPAQTSSRMDLPTQIYGSLTNGQFTFKGLDSETQIRDASTRNNSIIDTLHAPLEPWSPLGRQHDKRAPQIDASVHTKHGTRASTPQVPMRTTYHDQTLSNRTPSLDWPNSRTNSRARTVEDSSESRDGHSPRHSANLPNRAARDPFAIIGPKLPALTRPEPPLREFKPPNKNNPYEAYVSQRGLGSRSLTRRLSKS